MDHSSLAGVTEIDGIPLVDSAAEWRANRGILVTTARAFKGLEADAVVIYDLGELNEYFCATDLYVACTRARSYLHAIVHNETTARRIQAAIDSCLKEAGGVSR